MGVPLTGQVEVGASALQLDSAETAAGCQGFTIRAPVTNNAVVYIGAAGVTSSTGHQLDPGNSLTYERQDQNGQTKYQLRPSDFYVVGTSGDKVTWLASP